MARKNSKTASAKVERAMKKRKAGTLKSGGSGKTVKSRKQAIAIGLSEARAEGNKAPRKTAAKKSAKQPAKKTTKKTTKKNSAGKTTSRKTASGRTTKRKAAKKT